MGPRKSVRQSITYCNYDKTHSVYFFHFDLEIELKTIIDDIFRSVCEKHWQEKASANEAVEEFDLFYDNHYIDCDIHNSQVENHSCENNPMIENALDDGIDD